MSELNKIIHSAKNIRLNNDEKAAIKQSVLNLVA